MKFKSYITGNDFESILYTDHKPLVGLFKNKEPTDRQLTNWILEFSQLKIKVQYEEGKKNVIADSFSRLPRTKDSEEVRVSSATPLMDNYINSKFIQINGQEYYKEGTNLRKVIKNEVHKNKLLLEAHQVGHEFFLKTYDPLRRDYYWENMTKDVNLMVKTCPRCQLFRPGPFPKKSENYATPAEAPFVRVGLDLIGPLYVTNNNNQYIVVLIDYFTGWVEVEPLKRIESKDIIKFLSTVFSRHGIPELLITDNGPQFISAQIKGFLDIYGIYMLPATPYHPETNGKVENRNKEIGKYLRLLNEKERHWDELLPSALWALRTVKSEKTGFSSFELMYGRREKQPFELLVNIDRKSPGESQEEFLLRKFIKHRKWIQEAIENIEHANALWKDRRQQVKRMKNNYRNGDLLLVRYLNRKKLDPFFLGPLKVVKTEFNTVTLCDSETGEIMDRNVHKKNIVPYFTK